MESSALRLSAEINRKEMNTSVHGRICRHGPSWRAWDMVEENACSSGSDISFCRSCLVKDRQAYIQSRVRSIKHRP